MNAQATKSLAELNKDLEAAQGKLVNGGFKEEDFKAIKDIQASIKKFEDEKNANVKSITDKITQFGFTLSDIFTYADIKKAGYVKADVSTTPRAPSTPRVKVERPSDKGIELFNIPKGDGKGARGFEYNKGRIFEDASTTIKTPYASASKALVGNVKTKEDLMKFVSAKNKAEATNYLNSPAGQKEVNAILAYIKNDKLTVAELKAL
ncbi:hypothetical protein [Methylovorus glucosotrophus]|uniref:Uncharacterized protein n=1 Tax=Methylovorus glucosotrophus (strain SIP3-4) TaxID=582744 RepID=C6X801_METGS|nr:hypothetical protein [Methylovorus glucosotrophus]ACT51328.1 hypothetical protein Msip34_2086 [Methylovorus glucosotrophus SIP3-4]